MFLVEWKGYEAEEESYFDLVEALIGCQNLGCLEQEMKESFESIPANFVFADTSNNIAFAHFSDLKNEADSHVFELNPEQGFFVSANNPIFASNSSSTLQETKIESYRAQRLSNLLTEVV